MGKEEKSLFAEVVLDPKSQEIFRNFRDSERFKVIYEGMSRKFKRKPPKNKEELKRFNHTYNVFEKEKALPGIDQNARLIFVTPKIRDRVRTRAITSIRSALKNINNNLVIGPEGSVVFVELPFTSKEFPRLTKQYGL